MFCTSRSGYYKHLQANVNKNGQDEELIKEIFYDNEGKVGSRQIVLKLKEQYGVIMNRKKVIRLMDKCNLICKIRKKQKNTQKLSKEQYIKENILNRQFRTQQPVQTICTDITYLYYNNKKCYLCAYADAKTGEILDYQLSKEITRYFVLESTQRVLNKYTSISMIHTDRGTQYTSKDFNDLMIKNKVVHSMSNPGSPIDNSVIESFWGHMKDYLDLRKCKSFQDVIDTVDKYMYDYNNRPQWNKNKLTPIQYREFLLAA